jgi:uncharacterized membrane protein
LVIWIKHSLRVFELSVALMLWNLFLAFIPLILSLWLFRGQKKPFFLWWLGVLIFIVFLPNAPYVLTDIIHLIDIIRNDVSVWIVTLVVIPQYILFILLGFQAYVISLINLGYYLKQRQLSSYILPVEIIAHALSAVGIYLGRFQRFNSWDFLNQPIFLFKSIFENFTNKNSTLIMAITFIVLVVIYLIFKQINLGIYSRIKQ